MGARELGKIQECGGGCQKWAFLHPDWGQHSAPSSPVHFPKLHQLSAPTSPAQLAQLHQLSAPNFPGQFPNSISPVLLVSQPSSSSSIRPVLPFAQPSFPRLTVAPLAQLFSPVLPALTAQFPRYPAQSLQLPSSSHHAPQPSSPTSPSSNSPVPPVSLQSFPSFPARPPDPISSVPDWNGMWCHMAGLAGNVGAPASSTGLLGAGKGCSVMFFTFSLSLDTGWEQPRLPHQSWQKGQRRRMRGDSPPAPPTAPCPQPSTADVHFQWDRMPEIPLAPFPR